MQSENVSFHVLKCAYRADTNMNSQRIGVLGGGQLGRMLVEAASRLNISVAILDVSPDSPAKQIAATPEHVNGDFKDPTKIKELATKCDIITIEIEHVNTNILELLEKESHVKIHPSPRAIRLIQDKYAQKVHLADHNISVADFVDIPDKEALILAGRKFGYPFMLKSKTLAYDGRGNYAIHAEDDIPNALVALSRTPLYAERWVSFVKELAVMVVRRANGEVSSYPVVETIHKDNICHMVFAPAQIDGIVREKARELAMAAVKAFEGAGVFGVEMFLMDDDQIYINEIAPRPHNSGHYTIEACETSQYENHIRSILDMPLGSTRMKLPAAAMINILGVSDSLHETLKPCAESLTVDGATIHLYGKQECRKGRKMGHITIVGDSMLEVHKRIQPILQMMEPEPHRTFSIAPLVSIIMGSDSDLPVMKVAAQILKEFDVPFEISIVSAHRTPIRMVQYAKEAHKRDIKVIIAGAGGAAHLPGMVAALTPLPVIGVPVKGSTLDGVDSLYSIVQMPRGIPVATVAINNSTNAALLAIRQLAAFIPDLTKKMEAYMARMEKEVITKVSRLDDVGWENY